MPAADDLATFPAAFLARSDVPERRYAKRADCFALRGAQDVPRGLRLLHRLDAESIDVLAGSPDTLSSGERHDVCAVYSLTPHEQPAVPTGRVFVTFAADEDEPGLERTPYEIESRPGYAPHAAWLVARDGGIATALSGLEALARLEGIASVEPQMLRPVTRRSPQRRPRQPRPPEG